MNLIKFGTLLYLCGFRRHAKVAQLVEQLICNQPVVGSIPIFGLTKWVVARVVKGDGL